MPTRPRKLPWHPRWVRLGLALTLTGLASAAIKPGDAFPELAPYKLEGTPPAALKHKVVLVDFWASWCGPCKESFPAMEELQERFGKQGLVIIAVNVDENRGDMKAFLKDHAASFTVLRDAHQQLVEKAGIATMPSSFLLDRDGKVRFVHSGFRGQATKREYVAEIESLLKD